MNKHHNGGFSLIELLVTIVVGSIVTLAATTVLLLGLRLNKSSSDTISDQNTTRIMYSALDNMASQGTIGIVSEGKADESGWKLKDEAGNILLSYSIGKQTVFAGDENSTPLLEGVSESTLTAEGSLLTISVVTKDGTYTASSHCRMPFIQEQEDESVTEPTEPDDSGDLITDGEPGLEDVVDVITAVEARREFLKVLISQYSSKGMVLVNGVMSSTYYSQWYNSAWPTDTPWCACFVSWALDQISDQVNAPTGNPKWYANVDYFMAYLLSPKAEDAPQNNWKYSYSTMASDPSYIANPDGYQVYSPVPGDLIFFDWTVDDEVNPAHIGVVLTERDGYVYTIEGNSNNAVAIRKYLSTDPRILGYGILDWVEPVPDSTEPAA